MKISIMKRFFLGLLSLSFLFCLEGCGGSRYPLAPVQGKVTCGSKPLTGGTVIFTPVPKNETDNYPGGAASGRLDKEGRYVLSTYTNGDGAIVGKHQVSLSLDDPYAKLNCTIPTDLVLEVKGKTKNELNIEMKELK